MNGIIKNDINAVGNVKIELLNSDSGKVKDVIVEHNTATIDICRLIANALVGNGISGKIPGYIVPIVKNTATDEYDNMFSFGVPYQETPYIADITGGCSAISTYLIENTLLSTGRQVDGFRLLGLNKVNYQRPILAEIVLSTPLNITDSKTNLKVTWSVNIKY